MKLVPVYPIPNIQLLKYKKIECTIVFFLVIFQNPWIYWIFTLIPVKYPVFHWNSIQEMKGKMEKISDHILFRFIRLKY